LATTNTASTTICTPMVIQKRYPTRYQTAKNYNGLSRRARVTWVNHGQSNKLEPTICTQLAFRVNVSHSYSRRPSIFIFHVVFITVLKRQRMLTGHLRTIISTLPYVSYQLSIIRSVNSFSRIFFEVVLVNQLSSFNLWEFRPYTKKETPRLRKIVVDSCTILASGLYKSAMVGVGIASILLGRQS
jgi:hypothetical protein